MSVIDRYPAHPGIPPWRAPKLAALKAGEVRGIFNRYRTDVLEYGGTPSATGRQFLCEVMGRGLARREESRALTARARFVAELTQIPAFELQAAMVSGQMSHAANKAISETHLKKHLQPGELIGLYCDRLAQDPDTPEKESCIRFLSSRPNLRHHLNNAPPAPLHAGEGRNEKAPIALMLLLAKMGSSLDTAGAR